MRRDGPARRLSIIIQENDQYRHHALYAEIVMRAQKAGLAGATVLRGVQGFGAAQVLHAAHTIMDTAPVQVIIVDTAAKIDAFAHDISPLVDNGLVVVEDLHAVRYDRR
ncbi:MAG TPA: DUF190 domain-containing protein [Streptosporangiaceae bacterium]|jgi:hypothetical protein